MSDVPGTGTTQRLGEEPPVLAAPPTVRGTAPTYRARSNWPAVLGVIGLVMGVGGALASLWNALSYFMMDPIIDSFAGVPGQAGTIQAMKDHMPIQSLLSAFGVPVAVLLIVGASLLVARRPLAARLLPLWAVVKIALSAVICVAMYFMQAAQFSAMAGQPGAGVPAGAFMSVFAAVMAVLYFAWFLILPVIYLVWFSRASIREEVATWGPARRAAPARPAPGQAVAP